jgi:hypothetical protein
MKGYYVYFHRKKSDKSIFYVGKGKDRRAYRTSGRSEYWNRIVNKHGLFVEILKSGLTEDQSFELEKNTIKKLKESGVNLCNLTEGGEGSSGCCHSDETKRLMSKNRKGRKHSEESKKLMSDQRKGEKAYWYGKNLSENHKQKLRDKRKGVKTPQETILKIKKALTGKKKPKESRINYSKAVRGTKNPRHDKTVFEFKHDSGTYEKCTKYDLRKKYNLCSSKVSKITTGKLMQTKGWRVVNENA